MEGKVVDMIMEGKDTIELELPKGKRFNSCKKIAEFLFDLFYFHLSYPAVVCYAPWCGQIWVVLLNPTKVLEVKERVGRKLILEVCEPKPEYFLIRYPMLCEVYL